MRASCLLVSLKARATYTASYIASVFSLKPVLDRVVFNDSVISNYSLSTGYLNNVDLAVIVSARPVPEVSECTCYAVFARVPVFQC